MNQHSAYNCWIDQLKEVKVKGFASYAMCVILVVISIDTLEVCLTFFNLIGFALGHRSNYFSSISHQCALTWAFCGGWQLLVYFDFDGHVIYFHMFSTLLVCFSPLWSYPSSCWLRVGNRILYWLKIKSLQYLIFLPIGLCLSLSMTIFHA